MASAMRFAETPGGRDVLEVLFDVFNGIGISLHVRTEPTPVRALAGVAEGLPSPLLHPVNRHPTING